MSARRRGLLLALAFFGLAVWLIPGQRVHAQPPWQKAPPPPHFRPGDPGAGQHRIWKPEFKADDIRDTLSKFGTGDAKADQMFLELLKQLIGERNPKAPPEEVDRRARELMADKEFRDRVADAIQKQKNINPDKWTDNGRTPQFTREEIDGWLRAVNGRGGNGDPFRLPQNVKTDPKTLPPFNPKNPNFDQRKYPFVDQNTEFDRKTGLPKDRKTGKLYDPRTREELDPNELQPFNPKNPLFDPEKFPFIKPDTKFDPETGLPKNDNGELIDPRTGKVLNPNELQPFNPKNPLFDRERFPFIDPKSPPNFDPKTGFPEDPVAGKPFDPRNGKPIDPKNPPRIKPLPDPNEPVNPNARPKVDQQPVLPPEFPKNDQPNPPDNRKFDPNNPLGVPANQDKDQAAKSKAVETATAIWEKNVGPIDESPAVKKALIDLVSDPATRQMMTDDKGNNIFDSFQKDNGKGENFSDWFGGDGKWEWPKFNWGGDRNDNDRNDRNLDLDLGRRDRDRNWDMDRNRDRWRDSDHSRDLRSGDSSSSGMGSLDLNGMQVPVLALLILLIALVATVVAWKMRGAFTPKQATLATEGGDTGWPVDPRDINTREDVVKVFEFLSVTLCGANAKTWTHSTIADELTELAASEPETALKLARLYELARYAPLDEPLTRMELLEARRLACELAGIDEV